MEIQQLGDCRCLQVDHPVCRRPMFVERILIVLDNLISFKDFMIRYTSPTDPYVL